MKRGWIGLIMLAAALAGCETAPVTPAPSEPKAAFSGDPKAALAQAEADVQEAKSKNALWTTATAALKAAQAAAAKGEWDAVMKNAKVASEQARLGIAQSKYPVAKHF